MSVNVTPHLNFRGDARAALEFYQAATGGELSMVTYEQMGTFDDPAEADLIVFGQVSTPGGFRIMAYDVQTRNAFDRGERSFFVSLRGNDADEINALWAGLSDGAQVIVPLGPSQWSPLYGMMVDRFGITWVVDVEVQWTGA